MLGYATLAAIALVCNRKDLNALVVTLVVTAGVFTPIPRESACPENFYTLCALVEFSIMCAALTFPSYCSGMIVRLSGLLIITHAVGWFVGPQPGFGPYRLIVPILEYTELVSCIVCSAPVLTYTRKHYAS